MYLNVSHNNYNVFFFTLFCNWDTLGKFFSSRSLTELHFFQDRSKWQRIPCQKASEETWVNVPTWSFGSQTTHMQKNTPWNLRSTFHMCFLPLTLPAPAFYSDTKLREHWQGAEGIKPRGLKPQRWCWRAGSSRFWEANSSDTRLRNDFHPGPTRHHCLEERAQQGANERGRNKKK